MNPVKAGMVEELVDYRWSSYQHNALGKVDRLITEHDLYSALANDIEQGDKHYRVLFDQLNIAEQEKQITEATIRGEVYGSDSFHAKVGA